MRSKKKVYTEFKPSTRTKKVLRHIGFLRATAVPAGTSMTLNDLEPQK